VEHESWILAQPPYCFLSPQGQSALTKSVEVVYLGVDDYIARSGEHLTHAWILRRGAVRRLQPGPDVVVEEGESIGVVQAMLSTPLDHDHQVIEEVLSYLIPAETLAGLVDEDAFRLAAERRNPPSALDIVVTAQSIASHANRVDQTATVAEAARAMEQHRTDALLVDGLGEDVGIVTTSDLQVRVLAADRGPTTLVGEIATPRPRTIHATASLAD